MAKKIIVENAEEQIKNLASAFLTLSDVEECYAFFDDLFTTKEIAEISSRLEVARLLKAGENYIDIATKKTYNCFYETLRNELLKYKNTIPIPR